VIARRRRNRHDGQSIVEFAMVLPILMLFFMGMTEVGFAMYNYLRLAGANREGARLASRGRFEDHTVAEHIVAAGGSRSVGGVQEPNLKTGGTDANTGIILTRYTIPLDPSEPIPGPNIYISGTITYEDGGSPVIRPIEVSDSRLSDLTVEELFAYLDYRRGISGEIQEYRESVDFEVSDYETFVIVETFFAHKTLTRYLPFLGEHIQLSFDSTLRILEDSRLD